MRVFIAGAGGAIGVPLARLLVRDGHQVTGMTRSTPRAEAIRGTGAQAVLCDVYDGPRLREVLAAARPEVVINQLTSIPARLHPRSMGKLMAATNRLRTEGTAGLLAAAREAGASRFISQSIAFGYEPRGGEPADEEEPLYFDGPGPLAEIVRAVDRSERSVLDRADLQGVVLRYGYFYGPGTVYAPDGAMSLDVKRRRVPVVGDGGGVFSFVHIDDAAAATARALSRGGSDRYNVVDDDPAPLREWLPRLAATLGARRPPRVPRLLGRLAAGAYGLYLMTAQRGASNRRAKKELDWNPAHPTWRDTLGSSR